MCSSGSVTKTSFQSTRKQIWKYTAALLDLIPKMQYTSLDTPNSIKEAQMKVPQAKERRVVASHLLFVLMMVASSLSTYKVVRSSRSVTKTSFPSARKQI